MQYHLSCYDCGYETPEDNYYVTCPKCKGFLEVTLDMPLEERVFLAELPSIFKYQHFMPYSYEPGYEGLENFEATPEFVDLELSERLDVELVVKDETVLPTGTWKDREGFVSIHRLVINNIDDLTIFSAGNTAASLARSATLFKGPRLHMVIPSTSKKRIEKFRHFFDNRYVKIYFFDGGNDECIQEAARQAKEWGYPTEGGFANYARREGIKLMALEHVFQGTGKKIDWYVQPVAGGIGIYSFEKVCRETGVKCPKLLGVQPEVCDPMVRAWKSGLDRMEPQCVPKSIVRSEFVAVLRTRDPGDAYRILKKVMDRTNGAFESVSEMEIYQALRLFYCSDYFKERFHTDKVTVGLEPATALAGVAKSIQSGLITKGSRVLLNVSGAAKEGDVKWEWLEDLL